MIDFEKEISVIVARGSDGTTAVFPVCENIHRQPHPRSHARPGARRGPRGRERLASSPARSPRAWISSDCSRSRCFCRRDGELIINELAPRPHNSGHWTIEGCVTSQFEQQVRAVCGLPLGATGSLRPAAMVNLLGDVWSRG